MVSLGIDTSNYTTSVALYDSQAGQYESERKLLSVPEGGLGLRQSEAVFQHTIQLPQLMNELFTRYQIRPDCISVSVRPSEEPGSYMPCFLTGKAVADSLAAAMGVPGRTFSHQAGHIAAVLCSAKREDLLHRPFYAFHLSGGTTDALYVEPDDETIFRIVKIGGSLDLKAGQAIDRVGKMLGLPFPAGKSLDRLSCLSKNNYRCKPFFKGDSFSFSGIENQCRKMYNDGMLPEDIAKYCLTYICTAIEMLTEHLTQKNADIPIVFSGGVSANTMLQERIRLRFPAVFARDGLASDNAVGIAWLGAQ